MTATRGRPISRGEVRSRSIYKRHQVFEAQKAGAIPSVNTAYWIANYLLEGKI